MSGVITRQARTRLGLVGPFVGDGLLAVAIAVAAGFAASMSTSSEPADALLIALAAGASLTLAVRRLYPMTVLVVVVGTTAFFAWKYGGS